MTFLGLLFLAFLFSTCEKEEITSFNDPVMETRAKACTKTETRTTIKVEVPADASAEDIWNALEPAYTQAKISTKNTAIKEVLDKLYMELVEDRMENNYEACNAIHSILCTGFGFEMPFIRYTVIKNQLIIVVVNLVIVEEGAAESYDEHEDFHAYVAAEIVKKCSEQAACETGLPCTESGDLAQQTLQGLNDSAQALFDEYSNNGEFGDQAAAARAAVKEVVSAYLVD